MTVNEDIRKHKELFLSEARELVATMNAALLRLEKTPEDPQFLHGVFRAAHTMKSLAAAMNYTETERLCHAMEDILDAIKKKEILLSSCSDLLFQCFDYLEENLKSIDRGDSEAPTDALLLKLQGLLAGDESHAMHQDEQVSPQEPTSPIAEPRPAQNIQAIEVKVERLDRLMNLAEELLVSQMRLEQIRESLQNPELTAAVETLGRLTSEIQYNVMQARLVPIGVVFNRFPRMVRDLAKLQGKEVNLKLEGSDIELDRTVIDEIGESLAHLLRNAVDHGLEIPEEREKAGKNREGTIKVSAERTKEFAVITVEDDGMGLPLDEIHKLARERGILTEESTPEEILNSIFSGISTTQEVSTVSGRGLGLNIVKQKVESIGGRIQVNSHRGQGAIFKIEIPLTLAIIKTLFVTVSQKLYAIPIVNIDRLVTASREEFKGMLNYEAIVMENEDIPISRLDVLFNGASRMTNYESQITSHQKQPIVIIKRGTERLGLAVDSLVSTQEVVIKPFNRMIRENRFFAGSALIGSGEVVLILDTTNLFLTKRKEVALNEH